MAQVIIPNITPGTSGILLVRAVKQDANGNTYSDYASIPYTVSGTAPNGGNTNTTNSTVDMRLSNGSIYAGSFAGSVGILDPLSGSTTGNGVVVNQYGIIGYATGGVKKFYIDSRTGNAYFSGIIEGSDIYVPTQASPTFSVIGSTGSLSAKLGDIGGWTISSTSIYKNGIELNTAVGTGLSAITVNSSGSSYYVGITPPTGPTANTDTVIWAGAQNYANRSLAAFRVTAEGKLYATGAVISGTVTANALSIDSNNYWDSSGLKLGDGTDVLQYVASTGILSLSGDLIANGTITGGTIRTSATANTGIKLSSSGLIAYNGTTAVTTISTSDGSITSTNGTFTGGKFQTATGVGTGTPNAIAGVLFDSTGIKGYSGTGTTPTFSLSTAGALTSLSGSIGTWVIGATTLKSASNNITLDATGEKIYIGTGTFGNTNTGFYVDGTGQFSLKDQLTFVPSTTVGTFGQLTVSGKIRGAIENVTLIPSNKLQVAISGVNITGSTAATITTATHSFITGEYVTIEGLTGNAAAANGARQITVVNTTTFTVAITGGTISNTTGITGATATLREMTLGLHPAEGTVGQSYYHSSGEGLRLDAYNWWFTNNQFRVGTTSSYLKWDGSALAISGGTSKTISLNVGATDASNIIAISSGTPTYANSNTPFYVDGTGQFSLANRLYYDNTALTITNSTIKTGSTANPIWIDPNSSAISFYKGAGTTSVGHILGYTSNGTASGIIMHAGSDAAPDGSLYPNISFLNSNASITGVYTFNNKVTFVSQNNFTVAQKVTISGIVPSNYNTIATVLGGDPHIITAVTPSTPTSGYVTYTTKIPHTYSVGDLVTIIDIDGGTPTGGYSVDDATITAISSTTFTIQNSTTGSATLYSNSKAQNILVNKATIQSVAPSTPSSGFVTYTTTSSHGFVPGQLVTVLNTTGGTPSGGYTVYEILITAVTNNTFTISNSTTGSATVMGTAFAPYEPNSNTFTISSTQTGSYVSGGTAKLVQTEIASSYYNYIIFPDENNINIKTPSLTIEGLTNINGSLIATSIRKAGGTANQYLKADGSVSDFDDIIPLDDLQDDFDGVQNRFLPLYRGEKVYIGNAFRLLLTINGIIQRVGYPEYVWDSPFGSDGFMVDDDGYLAFSEAPPAGSTFDARIMAGPTTNTSNTKYPFKAMDILLGAY
jgi:hypothetical protein